MVKLQKQQIILIVGIILALIAVSMVKVYLDQQRELIKKRIEREGRDQMVVLVAKKEIPAGVEIDAESIEERLFPKQFVQPQAVTSLGRIFGMVTVVPIAKDEQLTLSKLRWPRESGRGGSLASATPVGKRAITISVDNVASLAGMIKAGDYVDVISMIPVPVQTQEGKQVTQVAVMPIFQNVLVLAVGQQIGILSKEEARYRKEEEKGQPSSVITLALSPQEANLIAFVQEQGKIRLVLRSPADSQVQPVQPASWDTLFRMVMPQAFQQQPSEAPKPKKTVEVYRGLNKEVKSLE